MTAGGPAAEGTTDGAALPVPVPAGDSGGLVAADREPFAGRTMELLAVSPTRMLWDRAVDDTTRVWARVDDVLVVGNSLVDPRTGLDLPSAPSPFLGLGPWSQVDQLAPADRPATIAGTHSGTRLCLARRWQGLVVLGQISGGQLAVEATSARTGEVAWQHLIVGDNDIGMWFDWFGMDGSVLWRRPPNGAPPPPLRFLNPAANRPSPWALEGSPHRWALDPLEEPVPGRSSGGADVVVTDGVVVAGVDPRGSVRWRIRLARYAGLIDLYATGDDVVALSLGLEGNERGWLNVCVRRRADGLHRWNRWFRYDADFRSALTITDTSVVTLEGTFLRASDLGDGSSLWAKPVESIPGMSTSRHPGRGGHPRLVQTGHGPRTEWAWLQRPRASRQRPGPYDQPETGTSASTTSTFVHGITEQVIRVAGAIHMTADGLVITRTAGAILCLALPESTEPGNPTGHRAVDL